MVRILWMASYLSICFMAWKSWISYLSKPQEIEQSNPETTDSFCSIILGGTNGTIANTKIQGEAPSCVCWLRTPMNTKVISPESTIEFALAKLKGLALLGAVTLDSPSFFSAPSQRGKNHSIPSILSVFMMKYNNLLLFSLPIPTFQLQTTKISKSLPKTKEWSSCSKTCSGLRTRSSKAPL